MSDLEIVGLEIFCIFVSIKTRGNDESKNNNAKRTRSRLCKYRG